MASSSIFEVEMGSSALVGSSMSSTSGSTASARAMQRRCCCPPERPRAFFFRRSLTSSQMAAPRSELLDDLVELCAVADAMRARAVGDVVVDAHGEGIRLLEYHADLAAQARSRPCRARRCPARGTRHSPSIFTPGTRSFMRSSVLRNVDLPQPDGPMRAVMLFSGMSMQILVSA